MCKRTSRSREAARLGSEYRWVHSLPKATPLAEARTVENDQEQLEPQISICNELALISPESFCLLLQCPKGKIRSAIHVVIIPFIVLEKIA